jgi:NAD(P)-dependent dehydrogenase (short-subunit alcohol dehydrogenase family)
MNNLFDIKGNVTVITGGTGVLGRAIAKYLALNGAKVVILGRKEDVGNQIAADIRAEGGECEFMKTDVLNVEVVRKNCEDILAKYGRVDTLLNAAGGNMPGATIPPDKTIFDLQPDQFQTVLDLNLTGTVIPTQIFLEPMVKQGKGAVINFSSMAAFRPMTRVAGYAAAKAGISNFTAYMATECAKKFGEGIRVNAIAPGFIQTAWHESRTQESYDRINKKIALHRFGEVEDVANLAYCILTNSYMNGSVVDIHGGYDYF